MSDRKWEWIGPHRVVTVEVDGKKVYACTDCQCRWVDVTKVLLTPCCQAGDAALRPAGKAP